MLEFTVAVRGSDGAVFHQDRTRISQLVRLAYESADKWRYIIRQVTEHRRSCRIRLIVGYTGCRYAPVWKYEEMTIRVRDEEIP